MEYKSSYPYYILHKSNLRRRKFNIHHKSSWYWVQPLLSRGHFWYKFNHYSNIVFQDRVLVSFIYHDSKSMLDWLLNLIGKYPCKSSYRSQSHSRCIWFDQFQDQAFINKLYDTPILSKRDYQDVSYHDKLPLVLITHLIPWMWNLEFIKRGF